MRIPETPEFDPIAFLVTLKFPKRNRGSEAWSWVLSDGSDGSAEAKAYEKELRLKSIEEINQLVALERERIAETRLEREEAEEKRRATAEANIFYNHPKNDADVEYWGKLPFWNLEEAVSLSFGKNPKTVNITTLKPHLQVSDFARKFSERLEHVQRAEITRQLSKFCKPDAFIDWALRMGIDVPWSLQKVVFTFLPRQTDWQARFEAEHLLREKAEAEVADLRAQLKSIGPPQKPDVSPRVKASFQRLILGMAIRGYRYDPRAAKSRAIKDITDDLTLLGIRLDEDTVRKYLSEASAEFPDLNTEQGH